MSDQGITPKLSTVVIVVCSVFFSIYTAWFYMPEIARVGFLSKLIVNILGFVFGSMLGAIGHAMRDISLAFSNPIPQLIFGYLMPVIGPLVGASVAGFLWVYLFH